MIEDIISATPWRTPAKPTDYDCAVVNWWHMVGPDRPAWQVADTLEQRCRSAALRLEVWFFLFRQRASLLEGRDLRSSY